MSIVLGALPPKARTVFVVVALGQLVVAILVATALAIFG